MNPDLSWFRSNKMNFRSVGYFPNERTLGMFYPVLISLREIDRSFNWQHFIPMQKQYMSEINQRCLKIRVIDYQQLLLYETYFK